MVITVLFNVKWADQTRPNKGKFNADATGKKAMLRQQQTSPEYV